jgi:hypothetical protein
VSELAEACVAWLRERGVALAPGLSAAELGEIEGRFGFAFAPDHRALLGLALPVGERWVDWRGEDDARLRERLAWPVDGALFDVEHSGFWQASWGERPGDLADALRTARGELERWPRLVPLCGHRYLPAAPVAAGAPVFSVYQTDVIFYGANLLDYVQREFGDAARAEQPIIVEVPPWSLLAAGYGDGDL